MGPVQERERRERRGKESGVGKAAGDERVFIAGGGSGLPDAAGGEGSTGAARPEGVIHRNRGNQPSWPRRHCQPVLNHKQASSTGAGPSLARLKIRHHVDNSQSATRVDKAGQLE